nr:3'(2')5' bisphosphate nucleotidase 1 [Hymenolepis microstoma]
MEPPFVMRLLASSVSIANYAGSIIRKVLSSGELGIVDKGVNDLQTQADRSVQHCIVSSLSKNFPEICIIGEEELGDTEQPHSRIIDDFDSAVLSKACPENLRTVGLKDVVVWVDPLDGTSEFTSGVLEHVTILIGVAVHGRAVGGVVCQPFYMPDFRHVLESDDGQDRRPSVQETTQRLIWGLEGLGVFGLSGEPISQAPIFNELGVKSEDKGTNRIVCTRSRSTPVTTAAINACLPSKLYRLGGCGYKMLMLLEGVAHAYIYASLGCKRWDTCAVEALINAVGGKLTGIDGREYSYAAGVQPMDFRGLIVTPNTAWHEEYVKRMPPAIVQSLVAAAPLNE